MSGDDNSWRSRGPLSPIDQYRVQEAEERDRQEAEERGVYQQVPAADLPMLAKAFSPESQTANKAKATFNEHLVLDDNHGVTTVADLDEECVDVIQKWHGMPIGQYEDGEIIIGDKTDGVRLSAYNMDALALAWLRHRLTALAGDGYPLPLDPEKP